MMSANETISKKDTQHLESGRSPYETALIAALEDLSHAEQDTESAREGLRTAEARVAELTQLVSHLVGVLPRDRASLYAQRLDELRQSPQPTTRSGPVHDNVVELFKNTMKREWSASDVQAALAEDGKSAEPKAVYNVLNYLVRSGRLRRVARGQYYIVGLGVGVQLDHDIEGPDPNGGGCIND